MMQAQCDEHPEAHQFSKRLGTISPAQFQAALDRFGLGRLVGAEPITLGNFGQNCFLHSTAGAFVLRGAPHYPWQFLEEQFFARLLHEHTPVPVPWPYHVEESAATFGWPYAIMPCLPGRPLADKALRGHLDGAAQRKVAGALGHTLADLQALEWPLPGAYDPTTRKIRQSAAFNPVAVNPAVAAPGVDAPAYVRQLLAQARAVAPTQTTAADAEWSESVIAGALDALREPFRPCCVMRDYQENNVNVAWAADGVWQVSGVFDLMGLFFGDGEVALSRQAASYAERDASLASEYVWSYLRQRPPRPGFAQRFPLYMLADRLEVWEWAHRTDRVWWDRSLSLQAWAQPATEALDRLVPRVSVE